ADDGWADEAGDPDGQLLPRRDATLHLRIARAHGADFAVADVVLPGRRQRAGAPLFLEAIRPRVGRTAAEVERPAAALDRALQQLRVHPHVRIGVAHRAEAA